MAAPAPISAPRKAVTMAKRKRVMPLGSARRFVFEPHGFYDTAAEVYERTGVSKKLKDGHTIFTRSKIRCSSVAEWMEVADSSSGKPVWRIEARYGDRAVYAPRVVEVHGKPGRPAAFLTAIRMYREYEKSPAIMLVHRDPQPSGIRDPQASKSVEVFLCEGLNGAIDPETELKHFQNDPDSARQFMPSLHNSTASKLPTADETFYFSKMQPGDDAFVVQTNSTFTMLTLSAVQEQINGTNDTRVLANMKRTVTEEPRFVEIDSALDAALVIAIFAAVDQLMLSHASIDYDVEWPDDYAYTMDQISHCFGPRKPLRKANTFLDKDDPANKPVKEERACFGLL